MVENSLKVRLENSQLVVEGRGLHSDTVENKRLTVLMNTE